MPVNAGMPRTKMLRAFCGAQQQKLGQELE